jgi:GntR family transcriptional regulator / MocR family aminotransferase
VSTSNPGVSEQTNSKVEGFSSDLLIDLSRGNGRGLREQLEHGLRTAIQDRRLVGGTVLPPTRVLAGELGISRSVVVAAYANLTADGYLEARQGSGTRVRADDQVERTRTATMDVASFWARPRQASPQGGPPIRLLGGLPDPALFPRAQWVRHYRAALLELPDAELTYPSTLGAEPLRLALAAYLGRVRGLATSAGHLLVCAGFTQGLTLVCRALRRAGARRIAVEDPCFGLHRRAVAMTGLEPVPIAVDEHGLDPAALADIDVAAVLVAPAHSYPTGGTLDGPRRHDLVAWARSRDALIIEDDYDAEFRYDRTPFGALQGLAPDHVVYIGSASKTVSPALRLGWVAAPDGLVRPIEREKRFDDMGSGLLEQLAFARFVDSGQLARFLRRVRPVYRGRRDATIAALGDLLPEARWQGAAAGLHLHVTLPEGVDERAFARAAYERGVLVEDAAWHWARPEEAPPSIVLGYGTLVEPAIRQGIGVLVEALEDVRGDQSPNT